MDRLMRDRPVTPSRRQRPSASLQRPGNRATGGFLYEAVGGWLSVPSCGQKVVACVDRRSGPHGGRRLLILRPASAFTVAVTIAVPPSRSPWQPHKKEHPRRFRRWCFKIKPLAVTYSCMARPHYHRRMRVSLVSSGGDQVVPGRYGRQGRRASSAHERQLCIGL